MSRLASTPSCVTYGEWVTRLRLACSQRQKRARRMNANGCSSWPTATSVMTTGAGHEGRDGGLNLQTAAASWPTPMAGTPAQNGNSAAGNSDFSRKAEQLAAATWMTPRTVTGEYTRDSGQKGAERLTLEGQAAQMWATPAPMQTREGWTAEQIEEARAKERAKGQNGNGFGIGLGAQATTWPTPAARADTQGDADIGAIERRQEIGKQIHLAHRARLFSHPAPETQPHGPTLSQLRRIWRPLRALLIASHGRATWRRLWKGRAKRRLNPLFVEWLMGWPSGHALCDCSATGFTRWQQDMRGALSALPMDCGPWIWKPPAETTETQLEMF